MTPQSVAVSLPPVLESSTARDWTLGVNAFELLLKHLDDQREEAGRKYISLYNKLMRYFEWKGWNVADWLADETMTRIAWKIQQKTVITNFHGFAFGVARNVASEALKEREREQKLLSFLPRADDTYDPDREYLLARIDEALLKLPPSGRELLLAYYATGDNTKMEVRRALAEREGISLNSLRIRVHRLRMMLEAHVKADLVSDEANVD